MVFALAVADVSIYAIIKSTSVGDARLSVMGVVDTRYGVSQSGADAER